MRGGGVVLNFARAPIVDTNAVIAALNAGQLHSYVCDFPSNVFKEHPKVVALPHLGASTNEAEDNCAIMVADALRDFLENGNVRHSVNYPEAILPRIPNTTRMAIANRNVPNMVGQISTIGRRGTHSGPGKHRRRSVGTGGLICSAVCGELSQSSQRSGCHANRNDRHRSEKTSGDLGTGG
jgi:hypothetical protein